ncbi:acetyl-CoA carboxylase biotin carboxyl carrier protein [Streptacidiphilus anmyonensis]|uniref:acetyl-CoA carboxylase biotin carboxyl carrier protein n=1 Tax=Streptacidiphilus anmyonensis TaxID=405782 RepID=UPI0006937001|nr:biotin/lipoyl-containing protein [Streptacidiphilus anmyonensis]
MKPDDEYKENAAEVTDADAGAETGAVLDAVCRSVTQLARSAPEPPRRIRMQDGQTTVEVEWPDPPRAGGVPDALGTLAGAGLPGDPAVLGDDPRSYVRAPMVGTFYHASAPDEAPFVRIGDVIRPGQPVGVLEAMKMMSTVTAETGGRVVEMIAPNAQPVEYDQMLIALEPVPVEQNA